MMSSVMPSEKYCWSASPLMLVNGSTAIEGLTEGGVEAGWRAGDPASVQYMRTGMAMFLSWRSPPSSKVASTLARTSSYTLPEMHTPPGSANASSRAAMFTPSP